MDTTLVISHVSALRAIRAARTAYGSVPWVPVGRVEARRALASCRPNLRNIDLGTLDRYGAWEDGEELDVLVASAAQRRYLDPVRSHVWATPLPDGALLRIDSSTYCTSPAFTALLYARHRTLPTIAMLLMELLGTYTLPASATWPLAQGSTWRQDDASGTYAPVRTPLSPSSEKPVEQTHYHGDPAVSLRELRAMSRFAQSSGDCSFRTAAGIVTSGSASPAESIMYGMLGFPMRHGGFALSLLPRGGMLLNHRIDFSARSLAMASGMPYAICDAYIPAANTDYEYNGIGHEAPGARLHDDRRNNGLIGEGIKVVAINRTQMRDIEALEAIAMSTYRDAGIRFRYTVSGYRVRQHDLLNGLRRATGLPPA